MPEEKLNPKQELFCQFYIKNNELFGNATHCYAEVYDYNLDELSRDQVKDKNGKVIEDSEYNKSINVCAVEGARLLRNPKIQDRLYELLNELLRDDIVDAQLSKLIVQNGDFDVKIAAIREYNKLKNRITEKIDHTTMGKELPTPIYGGDKRGNF